MAQLGLAAPKGSGGVTRLPSQGDVAVANGVVQMDGPPALQPTE